MIESDHKLEAFQDDPTKSRGSKMMRSDSKKISHGQHLENHFEKLYIFAKRFERFLNFFKNAKRPIF